MNLTQLKTKSVHELIGTATEMGLENLGRSRKQEVIFAILKKHAKGGEDIYGPYIVREHGRVLCNISRTM